MRTKNHVALEYFHQLEVAHNVYYVSSTSNTSALPSTNRRTFSRGKPTGSTTNGAVKKDRIPSFARLPESTPSYKINVASCMLHARPSRMLNLNNKIDSVPVLPRT